ncbi:MAG TPA: Uma2 family endonuclease [Bryobacteraceae bacterium]|jgi:Uma2 family endonuclease
MPTETLPPRKHFTRTEVEQMLDAGLFAGQRFELIDGDLIDKMGQNPRHAMAIRLLTRALAAIFGVEKLLVQAPVEVSRADRDRSWPEPDVAVVAEAKPDFGERHPRGDELVLAVEVVDSSVAHDATTKRDLYARAGVPEYWVLDLAAGRLIVHGELKEGRFQRIETLAAEDAVSLGQEAGAPVAVSSLLP